MGLFLKNKNEDKRDEFTRTLLHGKFGFDKFYWFPLTSDKKPADTEYFEDEVFFTQFGLENLITTVKEIGAFKVNKILETNEDTKIDADDIEPYDLLEVVYCNDKVDWLVYFSHENTVTISGLKLIDAIKQKWPDWDKLKGHYSL